jgi:hypothetical protein
MRLRQTALPSQKDRPIHRSRSDLGACLVKLKRYREAEEQSLEGSAGLKAALGDQRAQTQKAVSRIIELYESCGKPEKANPYRALPHANPDKSKNNSCDQQFPLSFSPV